jgi:hypothetical protein
VGSIGTKIRPLLVKLTPLFHKVSIVRPASTESFPYPEAMEAHFTAETEKKLNHLAAQSGRGTADALVQDVIEGYIDELAQTREMLSTAMTT